MNTKPLRPITDEEVEVESCWQDGAMLLPGRCHSGWTGLLQTATDAAMAGSGKLATGQAAERQSCYFELGLWSAHAAFGDFVYNSPASEVARHFLRTQKLDLFFDHLFVKATSAQNKTPSQRTKPTCYQESLQ